MSFSEGIYRQDDSIVSRRIEDEVILVPIRQNVADLESIYTLNEVGTYVWEQIDGQRTTAEILALTVKEFEVSEEEAQKDLTDFVQQLSAIGAITRV
ncbi:MAG: PqqD family protein [Anaerolineae bacterium]